MSEEAASEAAASERRLQRLCEAPALIVPLKQTLERLTLAPRIGIAAQPAANAWKTLSSDGRLTLAPQIGIAARSAANTRIVLYELLPLNRF